MRLEDVRVGMKVRISPKNGSMFAGPFKVRGQSGVVVSVESDGWIRVRLDGIKPPTWPYGACTPDMLEPLEVPHEA